MSADPWLLLDVAPDRTVRTTPGEGVKGEALAGEPYADVVIEAELSLLEGDENDLFGLYVRQPTPERYLALVVSVGGRVLAIEKDAQVVARVDADLAPSVGFRHGLRTRNVVRIVAAGPAVVLYVNDAPVTPVLVDQRFAAGFAGYYLRPGGTSPAPVLHVTSARVWRLPSGAGRPDA